MYLISTLISAEIRSHNLHHVIFVSSLGSICLSVNFECSVHINVITGPVKTKKVANNTVTKLSEIFEFIFSLNGLLKLSKS